jgi:Photosynthesis system II assembly factor YCF48/Putative zinc-finger
LLQVHPSYSGGRLANNVKLTMMQHLPRLLRTRLTRPQSATHPDANELAAFAENVLTRHERRQVLEHLAVCGECRKVLAVAQVQASEALPIATVKTYTWLRRPMLRWGTAAALVVVAGATAIVTMQRKSAAPALEGKLGVGSPLSRAEKLELSVAVPEHELDQVTKPASKTVATSQRRKQPFEENKVDVLKAKPTRPPEKRGEADLVAGLMATTTDKPAPTPLPQQRDGHESLTVGSEAVERRSENVAVAAAPAPAPVAPPATEVSKAKEAVSRTSAEKGSAVTGGHRESNYSFERTLAPRAMSPLANTLPRWTISAEGALQRSLDSGKTWEKVVVTGSGIFRAVSAVGADVWAGGSAGLLYHSPDAGQHWIRVQPIAAGTLKADITAVEFTDTQHGRLTTSEREIWQTSDAGQSWQVIKP